MRGKFLVLLISFFGGVDVFSGVVGLSGGDYMLGFAFGLAALCGLVVVVFSAEAIILALKETRSTTTDG